MTVQQLSVFAESKPGHLSRILEALHSAKVNVRGFSVSDTGDYGILRFIVNEPEQALEVLEKEGCACVLTPVLCLKLEDTPGELARVMSVLARCDINVIYSYSMISTYIILSTTDPEKARELLKQEPVELISQSDIKNASASLAGEEA